VDTLLVANGTNGLYFEPYDDVSMFQSQFGHSKKKGYFRIDSLSYRSVIHLLKGGKIEIIDGTRKRKGLPDSFKFGVTTFALVLNRALGYGKLEVAPWQTRDMVEVAWSQKHKPLVNRIRRMIRIFGKCEPIKLGKQIELTVYNSFYLDDRPGDFKKIKDVFNQTTYKV